MNELGYEFDQDFLVDEEVDLNDDDQLALKQEKDKEIPPFIKLFMVFAAGLLIGYGYSSYEHSLKDADNMVLLNDCSSKINALQMQYKSCETGKLNEIALRNIEINLTSQCWSDLNLANYEISVLKGYNFTKPALVKQLDKDRKEFEELSTRYYELEKKLGVGK